MNVQWHWNETIKRETVGRAEWISSSPGRLVNASHRYITMKRNPRFIGSTHAACAVPATTTLIKFTFVKGLIQCSPWTSAACSAVPSAFTDLHPSPRDSCSLASIVNNSFQRCDSAVLVRYISLVCTKCKRKASYCCRVQWNSIVDDLENWCFYMGKYSGKYWTIALNLLNFKLITFLTLRENCCIIFPAILRSNELEFYINIELI